MKMLKKLLIKSEEIYLIDNVKKQESNRAIKVPFTIEAWDSRIEKVMDESDDCESGNKRKTL